MAKRTTTVARRAPVTDQTSHKAITKTKLQRLLSRCASFKETMDEARGEMGEMIGEAVENDNLHKGAFAWLRKLGKMTPAKRNEQLFQFHVYCDSLGWPDKDLPLGDRAEAPAASEAGEKIDTAAAGASGDGVSEAAPGGDEDVRPRFLRSGGVAPAPPAPGGEDVVH